MSGSSAFPSEMSWFSTVEANKWVSSGDLLSSRQHEWCRLPGQLG
ncbi:unnamed protein product, partial [Staurois parvus]